MESLHTCTCATYMYTYEYLSPSSATILHVAPFCCNFIATVVVVIYFQVRRFCKVENFYLFYCERSKTKTTTAATGNGVSVPA